MCRSKVQRAGKAFGEFCKRLGAVLTIIGCVMTPNEDHIVNKGGIILLCLALPLFLYGAWRTGTLIIKIRS